MPYFLFTSKWGNIESVGGVIRQAQTIQSCLRMRNKIQHSRKNIWIMNQKEALLWASFWFVENVKNSHKAIDKIILYIV